MRRSLRSARATCVAAVVVLVTATSGADVGQAASAGTTAITSLSTSGPVSAELGYGLWAGATIDAGVDPTGTLTFRLFSPADPACVGTPAYDAVSPVTGNGTYYDFFSPTQLGSSGATAIGTWRWTIEYSGDSQNDPAAVTCDTPVEVGIRTPTLWVSAQPPLPVPLGGSVNAAVNVFVFEPTEAAVVSLFGPDDPTCAGSPAFSSQAIALAGQNAISWRPTFGPLVQAGEWRFSLRYPGDANNLAGSVDCANSFGVDKAAPSLALGVSPSTTNVGGSVTATAVLTGGANPIGDVVLNAFAPGDVTCSTPVQTATSTASPYELSVIAGAPGTWRVTATFAGDEQNRPTGTFCGAVMFDAIEAAPSLDGSLNPSPATAGDPLRLTGTLTGANSPTGEMTFAIFENATCLGIPRYADFTTVTGAGVYTHAAFPGLPASGASWQIAYLGDTHNSSASVCQAFTVGQAAPRIAITAKRTTAKRGDPLKVKVTLSGGYKPGGQVVFALYAPSHSAFCDTPEFTTTVNLVNGSAIASRVFTPASKQELGSWRWIATYAGDANNAGLATTCGDANTTVVKRLK